MTKAETKKRPKRWSRKRVGDVWLCDFRARVYVESDHGGGLVRTPTDATPYGEVVIGVDSAQWAGVVSTLIHELVEFALTFGRCSYQLVNEMKVDTQRRLIVCSHQKFDEATSEAGDTLAAIEADVFEAWKEVRRWRNADRKAD